MTLGGSAGIAVPVIAPSVDNEWAWFRRSLRDALLRPRTFAATLPRTHYGLAGLLVVLLVGVALSASVDAAVLLSKRLDPMALVPRLVTDAFLLATRLVVVVAVVALAARVAARLGRWTVTLDQLFTGLAFSLSPLLLAPLCAFLLWVAGEIAPPAAAVPLACAGALAALLVARAAYAAVHAVVALVGHAPAAPLLAAAALAAAFALQDQVSRVVFTALAYAPVVLPAPGAEDLGGAEHAVAELRLRLPQDWRVETKGVEGELARFERDDARLVVRRAGLDPLATVDALASRERAGAQAHFSRIAASSRTVVRVADAVALDDRWWGWIDGTPVTQRLYTLVRGRSGYALEFSFFDAEPARAWAEAASLAASVRSAR